MTHRPSPVTPDLNAIVMASAGTGKTWQLVTRLLRLLLNGAAPASILAITFTRKAASEMQTRLLQRLFALARADDAELHQLLREAEAPLDAATVTRARGLYEQLLRAPRTLRTTTFHAFCQEVLRRFPLEADVPPGFELIESSGELTEAAWDALLNELAQEPDGTTAHDMEQLLNRCGGMASLRSALLGFLEHRGDWWSFTEGVEDGIAFAAQRLQEQLQVAPNQDPLVPLFDAGLERRLAEFVALMARHPGSKHEQQLAHLACARDGQLSLEQRVESLQAALLTKERKPLSRKPSQAQATKMGGEVQQERFLQLAGQLAGALLDTLGQISARDSWQVNRLWYRLGSRLLSHFQRIKGEQRLLDFTDLEWRAYRLLTQAENAHWIQYKLDQRIDHLLVDEFQDTNPTQWRMLLPLLQEMAAGNPERHRSVFLVGDAKQSIYRFRRAEPRLFAEAQGWLEAHMEAQTFPLHSSRRSAPAIIEAVNQIFTHPQFQRALRDFAPHTTHLEGVWGRVTVLPQPLPEPAPADAAQTLPLRNPLLQPRSEGEEAGALLEGRQIAAAIRQLIDPPTLIGSASQIRPLHYGDIMLLLRSRTRVAHFEAALREAGIPFIGADRGTLLESLEVRDMIALLHTLLTPYNNLTLATVLRSPLFSCSSDELAILAARTGGNWWERLAQHDDAPPRLQRAAILLRQWHTVAGQLPIHDLLDRIYNEGNVLARYEAAYPDHLRPRVRANLVRFLELALEVDSGRYPSLNHFLARLEQLRESAQDAPDEAPASGAHRVRIMTIHASKGLESPVVFLADTDSGEGRDQATFTALVDWPAGEARPESFMLVGRKGERAPLTEQLLEAESEQAHRESANLLYVALTRARQLLYVSGSPPARGNGGESWYGRIRTALDPLAASAAEQPIILERGTRPDAATAPLAPPPPPPVPLPAGLSSPVAVAPPPREIAPSRSGTNATAPGDGDEDGRIRGIALHRFLQLLGEPTAHPATPLLAQVAAELELAPNDPQLRDWYHEAQRVIDHAPFTAIFAPSAETRSYCEVPLLYRLENGMTVHGIVDRLVVGPHEVLLVDYKSHRGAAGDTLAQLADHYREQMRLYVQGASRLWPGRTIRPLLLFTTPLLLHEVVL